MIRLPVIIKRLLMKVCFAQFNSITNYFLIYKLSVNLAMNLQEGCAVGSADGNNRIISNFNAFQSLQIHKLRQYHLVHVPF